MNTTKRNLNMKKKPMNIISRGMTPRHGHVFSPSSRAWFAWQDGLIDTGALNQCEAGKFFPAVNSGLHDPLAFDDTTNAKPPVDGNIASAGQNSNLILDEPGLHWKKHEVKGGETLDVSWHFTANHVTRRWNYFITREQWEPSEPLSRAQFEPEPFFSVEINLQPFWSNTDAMKPPSPTVHSLPLPEREGYHVLLAVWEVADTGNAFYQVIDLDFVRTDGGIEHPTTPGNLHSTYIDDKCVALSWTPSTGPYPIKTYRITRNGLTTVDIDSSLLSWSDNSVLPSTQYNYFVCAVDQHGNTSPPSNPIEITTLAEGGDDAPPTPPTSLHAMTLTATEVHIMWGASVGPTPLECYKIYRDGIEVKQVSGGQTSTMDSGLTPNTQYRYFVAAQDENGKLSTPSNVLKITTEVQVIGDHPLWELGESYRVGDIVSYLNNQWTCLQSHISYTESWAPGMPDSTSLWLKMSS